MHGRELVSCTGDVAGCEELAAPCYRVQRWAQQGCADPRPRGCPRLPGQQPCAAAKPAMLPAHIWHMGCPQRSTPGPHRDSVARGWSLGFNSNFRRPLGLSILITKLSLNGQWSQGIILDQSQERQTGAAPIQAINTINIVIILE